MAHTSKNDKTYKLIIEKMRFSEPRILILYGLFAIVLYVILASFGGYHYKIDVYIILILLFYVAFVIKGFLNKIHEFLEIGDKTQGLSPLRSLFVSEEAFLKYRTKIITKIFSKWQLYFSISFLLSFAIAVVFDGIKHGSFDPEKVTIWEVLITLLFYYLSWWIVIFAFLSLVWALLWFIVGFIYLKDAEGLKLNESIKSFKTLINIKKCDEEALNTSLEGYYTYNRFLADSRKINELSFFIAVRVAIVAILITINWIWVLAFMYEERQLPQISVVIFIDIIAVLIFIIPHLSIHMILKSAKSEISNIINEVYELNKIRAVVRYASFSQTEENLIKNLTFLKGIADETNSLKTWSIDLQAVIKLTATIVPTVLPYLIQILSGWLNHQIPK